MIKQTANAVKAMERANTEVSNGVKIVNETDEAFINIIKAIENIVNHVEEILDITGDEVASSDKVVSLINEVATITENNSINCNNVSEAVTEEANAINNLSATAEKINVMSEQLMQSVEKFKI